MSIILPTLEIEIRKIVVQAGWGKHARPYLKNNQSKKA
jgi:hypothetical protein